jgi:hypothetical protein
MQSPRCNLTGDPVERRIQPKFAERARLLPEAIDDEERVFAGGRNKLTRHASSPTWPNTCLNFPQLRHFRRTNKNQDASSPFIDTMFCSAVRSHRRTRRGSWTAFVSCNSSPRRRSCGTPVAPASALSRSPAHRQ